MLHGRFLGILIGGGFVGYLVAMGIFFHPLVLAFEPDMGW
jgi:hypothetical protein